MATIMNILRFTAIISMIVWVTACDRPTTLSVSGSKEEAGGINGLSKAQLQTIDNRLKMLVSEEDIPSLSVAIIYADENIDYLSYGTLTRGLDESVDADTIYQIASLSKVLTGVITKSLIRDEKIDVAAPVTSYLKPVLRERSGTILDGLTMLDLLHHRAGISDNDCSLYAKRIEGEAWLNGYSRAELLEDLNAFERPNSGSAEFQYSSCGYAIVGLVDELVSNQSYVNLLRERVTGKYEMIDTVVELDGNQLQRLATPYRKDQRQVATQPSVMGMGTPASALYSSTRDLAKLQVAQLQAYRAFGNDNTQSDLFLSDTTAVGQADNIRFGTGIIEFSHPEGTIYLHDGDADGYASFYAFAPKQNVGIVLLTGSGGSWVGDIGIELITLLMLSDE